MEWGNDPPLNSAESVPAPTTHTHPPVCDATGAQKQLSVASPFPLQDDVDVQLLIVDVDLLHAAVEVVQLGLALPHRVVGLRTT